MRYRYRNPVRRLFSGLYSILWLVIIIIFFATGGHFWVLFLIGALLSAVLGIVIRLVTAGIIGTSPTSRDTSHRLRSHRQLPIKKEASSIRTSRHSRSTSSRRRSIHRRCRHNSSAAVPGIPCLNEKYRLTTSWAR